MEKNVSSIVQAYLETVEQAVNQIENPSTGGPVQLPHFKEIYAAAGKLDSTKNPTEIMYVIQTLLSRSASVDFAVPTAVNFPADHHPHASMGTEWYWTACHLNVTDKDGNKGRVSTLVDMTRNRTVGVTAQQKANWSDMDVTIANTIATVTVDMGPGKKSYYRRSTNAQWPAVGGQVNFSSPGEPFLFECGDDSFIGTENFLPLNVLVNDGTNMQLNLVFTNQPSINIDTAFFLQGVPVIGGNGGTGLTPVPTPGIYYSWPQLLVSGTVTVGGNTYTVDSGTGWVDHQLMMTSLENAKAAVHPVPFVEAPNPFNGWVWQFYNLDNGMAFTGAGFIIGEMNPNPPFTYGYFLVPDKKGGWTAIYINGNINLLAPNNFPAECGNPDSAQVALPTVRAYSKIENVLLGHPLSGVAVPWYKDGTFNFPNKSVCDESPADFTDLSGEYSNGVGYLESVGFQNIDVFTANSVSILQNA